MREIINLIEVEIASGDIKSALNLLRSEFSALESTIADEVLVIISKLNEIERRNHLNLLTLQEHSVEFSKIIYSTINYKQKLKESITPQLKSWDITYDTIIFELPEKIIDKKVLIKNEIEFYSIIEFHNCQILFSDAKVSIHRSAKIKFVNCSIKFKKVVVSGHDSIGDDLQIINSDVYIKNCVLSEINRIEILNAIDCERKIEIIKCVFNQFKQTLAIENNSNDYVIIDNCVFNEFKSGCIHLNCRNAFVKKTVFSECVTGMQIVIKKPTDSIVISNCVFNDIKKAGIDFWIHSLNSKSIINDTTFSACEIGVNANIKNEEYEIKSLGEIDIQETLMIDNSNFSDCKSDLKIENFE